MLKDAVKALFIQFQHNDIAFGGDGCGARRVMDQRHFAEEISRAQEF